MGIFSNIFTNLAESRAIAEHERRISELEAKQYTELMNDNASREINVAILKDIKEHRDTLHKHDVRLNTLSDFIRTLAYSYFKSVDDDEYMIVTKKGYEDLRKGYDILQEFYDKYHTEAGITTEASNTNAK